MNFTFDLTVTMGVIVTVVLAIVGWVHSRQRRTDDAISAVTARVDRHENRLTSMEQTVTGLPGKDDMHDLRIALEGLRGDVKEVRVALSASNDASRRQEVVVQRVEQYLLERNGK